MCARPQLAGIGMLYTPFKPRTARGRGSFRIRQVITIYLQVVGREVVAIGRAYCQVLWKLLQGLVFRIKRGSTRSISKKSPHMHAHAQSRLHARPRPRPRPRHASLPPSSLPSPWPRSRPSSPLALRPGAGSRLLSLSLSLAQLSRDCLVWYVQEHHSR